MAAKFNPERPPSRKNPDNQRVSINLYDVPEREEWKRVAHARGISLSTLIREAVRYALANMEK